MKLVSVVFLNMKKKSILMTSLSTQNVYQLIVYMTKAMKVEFNFEEEEYINDIDL